MVPVSPSPSIATASPLRHQRSHRDHHRKRDGVTNVNNPCHLRRNLCPRRLHSPGINMLKQSNNYLWRGKRDIVSEGISQLIHPAKSPTICRNNVVALSTLGNVNEAKLVLDSHSLVKHDII